MRELRVEDALLYLDQVKIEFGERPHIYNEFLDIMKHFKAQQIDTPGVIQRVSNLFKGNKRLVLGFNTFLPEGYKIELDAEGNTVASQAGVPGTVTLAMASGAPVPPNHHVSAPHPHSSVTHSPATMAQQHPPPPPQMQPQAPHPNQQAQHPHSQHQQPQSMRPIPQPAPLKLPSHAAATAGMVSTAGGAPVGGISSSLSMRREGGPTGFRQVNVSRGALPTQQQRAAAAATAGGMVMQQDPSSVRALSQQQQLSPPMIPQQKLPAPPIPPQQPQQQQQQQPLQPTQPVKFDHAINYVTTIKKRFASQPQIYKSFLEILHTYQKEQRGIEQVLEDVSGLFGDHPDLLR